MWTIGTLKLSTFPPKVHSGPVRIVDQLDNCPVLRNTLSSISNRTALLWIIIVSEIANGNFLLIYLATFPRLSLDCSEFSFSTFSYREKIVHDRLHSNF